MLNDEKSHTSGTKSILKTVVMGMLFGAAVFFVPKFLLGLFIIFALVRFIAGRRMGQGRYMQHRFAFADKIRGMNDEEYTTFKTEMQTGKCNYRKQMETK
nr:hypothetical protein [Bacteroidota bacterium]